MDTIKINKRNTKMVAHRGLSGIERENSCAAFIAAGNRDYFGIETDIHRTADGKFIVIHDDRTGRVSPTDIAVEENTFDVLREVQLFDKDDIAKPHLRLPSLEEYVKLCARYEKVCVLELKSAFTREEIAEIFKICLDNTTLEKMIFISFKFENLVLLRELSKEANLQFLYSHEATDEIIKTVKPYGIDLDLKHNLLTKEIVDRIHAEGIILNCWTVDNPERAEQLTEWGVDYITTNILQ